MNKLIGVFWVAVFIFSSSCFAESIALTGNEARAPKIFTQDGKPQGILVEIVKYLQKETGQEFLITLYPFARAYNAAKNSATGIIGLSKTDERLPLFDFGNEVMFYDDVVLVVAKGKEFSFKTPTDLNGKNVGIARGGSYGPVFEKAVKDGLIKFVEGSTIATQLAMVSLGRLDAVLVSVGKAGLDAALATPHAKKFIATGTEFVVLPTPFARDPNYMAFAKSSNKSALLMQMDAAIKKGYASGEIPALIKNYTMLK